MLDFLKTHQLNIMLFMSGICGILVVLTVMTRTLSSRRRCILALLEAAAMFLLIADRYAYIYRGDPSPMGFWMVRISNFLVYFLTLYITHSITLYLFDLFRNEGRMTVMPKRLFLCEILFVLGLVLLVVSQFTGLYYTFDAQNTYQRADWNILCYFAPITITFTHVTLELQYRKTLGRTIAFSLILNSVVPLIASVIQLFAYGLSLTNMSVVGMAILLYLFVLIDLNETVERAKNQEIEFYKKEHEQEHEMFEQTAEALASAIDAKDPYTNGHSRRVAEYSLKIAKSVGKPEEECERVYFAALLHDVGKIGVPSSIINKKGRLSDEEFEQIKRHPVLGDQILSTIKQSPWLSIGARYHHERYGGKGYPEGLKGEEIPEIARIIAVADAYDAMTSNRSYRNAIPQHIVREEIVKGIGTQFDPEFAKAMLHMIDVDTEYRMQEIISGARSTSTTSLRCDSIYHNCSEGILITKKPTRIRLCSQPDEGFPAEECLPSLILFDALDGQVHPGEEDNRNLLYFEYAQIRLDGHVTARNTRNTEVRVLDQESDLERAGFGEPERGQRYKVEAARYKDHAVVRISGEDRTLQVILALPDSSRFVYIALSGEHCDLHNIRIENDAVEIGPDDIPRIAEEISYIKDCPEGDVSNVQVDGWRTDASEGILISDGMTLSFHTMSLPTARMVWHCSFVSVFSSDDGRINGANFREYILLRLDGENWESDAHVENKVQVMQQAGFSGWNAWKDENKKGLDCVVKIQRNGSVITMQTENLGIAISSVTTILDDVQDVYVALTGDQCAITNIRVSRGE